MRNAKPCLECGTEMTKPDKMKESAWRIRKFCDHGCAGIYGARKTKPVALSKYCADIKKPFAEYTVQDVIRACGGSTKLSEKLHVFAAHIRQWERVPHQLVTQIRLISGLPRSVIQRARSEAVGKNAAPAPEHPKRMQVEPFEAGHALTWGAMMPDISWDEAQRIVSGMGTR